MSQSPGESSSGAAKQALALAAVLAAACVLRLSTWPTVFFGGRVWIDGPDGYYHLRRGWLTLQNWPWTPQFDMLIGVPEGGPISWPPVFDLLLATVALPWRGMSVSSFEALGAFLQPVLGLVEILVLFWLVRRLFGQRAALWTAGFAAVLPGVARYSLLGALDHDPLVESIALLGLIGIAGSMGRAKPRITDVALIAIGAALLVLTWAGSLLQLALWCLVVAAVDSPFGSGAQGQGSGASFAVGLGCLVAALLTLPFVIASVWSHTMVATFIGLSWLHTAALLAAAAGGFSWSLLGQHRSRGERTRHSGSERIRWTGALLAVSVFGVLLLLRTVWPAVLAGLTFFGRGEDFLRSVAESRPLLSLFGTFDPRPALIRLSLLPLVALPLLPWTLRRARGDRRVVLVSVWFFYVLILALIQSRYAHAAALPVAALGGLWASDAFSLWPKRRALIAAAIAAGVLLPSIPAYVSVPGFNEFRFLGRAPKLLTTGMNEVCDFLRSQEPPVAAWAEPAEPSAWSVQAQWSFGHWLMWRGRQGTVATPLGPQGQAAFADGLRYYYADEIEARELLERHRVRYIVASAEVPPLDAWAGMAGVDADRFFAVGAQAPRTLRADAYLPTVAARLSWIGAGEIELFGTRYPPLVGIREVFRSTRDRRNPFGGLPGLSRVVPIIRVYEIAPR